jgi:hypothetical protein
MEAYDNYEGQEMEGDLYETEENLNFNARWQPTKKLFFPCCRRQTL